MSIEEQNDESAQWMSLLQDISNEDDDAEGSISHNYEIMKSMSTDKSLTDNLERQLVLTEKTVDYTVCSNCNVKGTAENGRIKCRGCGLVTKIYDDDNKFSASIEKDYNVSKNSFMSFNIVGKNSYCYQRSFLKTCANYPSFRENNNRKDMYDNNYQHTGKKIPKNAIKLAIELFSEIKKQGFVYRGNGKKGVLGACLFYACVIHGITKTPREIASVINIEERFLSQGDRIVQEHNENGVICIPTILRPLRDYVNQYFPTLGISDKYKQFVIDVIERAEKKNVHIKNDSRTTTKCIGAIYMLITRVKKFKHITKDKIVKECSISKSTFIRYYNLLMSNYKIIKPVFKKHRIPQPNHWRVTPKLNKVIQGSPEVHFPETSKSLKAQKTSKLEVK